MASVWPTPRKPLPARPSRLDTFKPLIDQMLRVDLDAPRKQRHTAKRIFDRLLEEHDADDVSYGMVRDYVRKRRPEIRLEAGRAPPQVFIEQSHRPGAEAEVDFGDVWVRLAGELTRCYLFSFRLSWSGKAIHRMFLTCSQEAFFEGHVHAPAVISLTSKRLAQLPPDTRPLPSVAVYDQLLRRRAGSAVPATEGEAP
ncbi:hypothetical protein ACIBHY_36275 [Nonomuraea sp. NPDC050547]|uniref:hypothetical protein n=1 Tax=Nonomuraea sp. NPDC050547 TaxID=3364368 RepID=UPI0037B2E1A5